MHESRFTLPVKCTLFLIFLTSVFSCTLDSSDEYCNLRVANYSPFHATTVELITKYGKERTNEQVSFFPNLQAGEVSAYHSVKVKLGIKSFFDSRTKPEVTIAVLSYDTDSRKSVTVAEDKFGSGYGVYSPGEYYTIFITNGGP